jgi:hypothetical protein
MMWVMFDVSRNLETINTAILSLLELCFVAVCKLTSWYQECCKQGEGQLQKEVHPGMSCYELQVASENGRPL